jgi:hypothetical protein
MNPLKPRCLKDNHFDRTLTKDLDSYDAQDVLRPLRDFLVPVDDPCTDHVSCSRREVPREFCAARIVEGEARSLREHGETKWESQLIPPALSEGAFASVPRA